LFVSVSKNLILLSEENSIYGPKGLSNWLVVSCRVPVLGYTSSRSVEEIVSNSKPLTYALPGPRITPNFDESSTPNVLR